jgi:two-component system cell cycle response regulator
MPSRPRILVVDDSAVVRTVVRNCLKNADVDEARDGEEALRWLAREAYDVVVTDLKMPGVDGLAVLACARESTGTPEVIILTGKADMDSAVSALRLGANDFLTKPPSRPEEVAFAVERALEKKRLRDANRRLMEQLEAMSRTDALTGLFNPRAFDEAVAAELLRTRRYRYPVALILFDVDHFKVVNDSYGHTSGDGVLRAFAVLIKRVVRETDLVFRFGGDEFAVLLPHAPSAGAMVAAQRIVDEWAAQPVETGTEAVAVSCSAGVAELDPRDTLGEHLTERADRALYSAKKAGRGRAELAPLPEDPPPTPPPPKRRTRPKAR